MTSQLVERIKAATLPDVIEHARADDWHVEPPPVRRWTNRYIAPRTARTRPPRWRMRMLLRGWSRRQVRLMAKGAQNATIRALLGEDYEIPFSDGMWAWAQMYRTYRGHSIRPDVWLVSPEQYEAVAADCDALFEKTWVTDD